MTLLSSYEILQLYQKVKSISIFACQNILKASLFQVFLFLVLTNDTKSSLAFHFTHNWQLNVFCSLQAQR